jgi:hypothetical protein
MSYVQAKYQIILKLKTASAELNEFRLSSLVIFKKA